MKNAAFPHHFVMTLALATAATLSSRPAWAWDNSAMIAQQQRDAARMASERAMQNMLAAQRQADMLQANRPQQMRQDNQLNDMRQSELRKSAERVYGLDRPVAVPGTAALASADTEGSRATGRPVFPAQSVWADVPNQQVVLFKADGSFKLVFPKDGQFFVTEGRYRVEGQYLRLQTGQVVENFAWALGSVVAKNGQWMGQLRLSKGQMETSWVECAVCPNL